MSISLKTYSSIGKKEEGAVLRVMRSGTLSGFIAGPPDERAHGPNGGPEIRALESEWAEKYGVRHALTFNSATSALLAAMGAIGLKPGDHVICPPWTMSATVAAPKFYGAVIDFADIEAETFCINPWEVTRILNLHRCKAVIAVNLFGHPARLKTLKDITEEYGIFLIEDSAQTPWATEHGKRAGTVGDIGIYSLNRHKHMNCGEGGIAVTNSDELAEGMRSVRNHGIDPLGLNLRMTELEAAIARCQLADIVPHVGQARTFGAALSDGLRDVLDVPHVRGGSDHDYYMWVARMDGVPNIPHIKGYIQPLHKIFTGGQAHCPVVEEQRKRVICFETCKYDLSEVDRVVEAFREAR